VGDPDEAGRRSIRWFSPECEMPLCGHATLAAAKTLFAKSAVEGVASFTFAGGRIEARHCADGQIAMDFPADTYDRIAIDPTFLDFFGLHSAMDCIEGFRTRKVALILEADVDLTALHPDYRAMRAYAGHGSNGIGITKAAPAGADWDFETRYFNPWAGVDEDPVTGSVHTLLAPYWAARLGKPELRARQLSSRPGELGLRIKDARVEISGAARIVFSGHVEV